MSTNNRLLEILAVWDQLIADMVGTNGEDCTNAFLKFDEAMDIFYSYFDNVDRPYLNTDRDKLQYALLHEEWGLCVCIVTFEETNERLIILRPEIFELDTFFDYVAQRKLIQKCKPRTSLDKLLVQRILSTLDSEWDRKVARVLLGIDPTRSQLEELGISEDDISKNTQKVMDVVEEIASSAAVAAEQVKTQLEGRKKTLTDTIKIKQDLPERKRFASPDHIILDEESSIKDMIEKASDIDSLLSEKNASYKKRLNLMRKWEANQILEENRVKCRKLGNLGAPRKLDDEDETFLAMCIEDKSTYHGSRHDLVMYTNRRVKSRDLLKIANYRLLKAGKQMIKSATTVYNRCKPKIQRSKQAANHIGKGLLCFKKLPQAEDKDNENTHYQRAHVKNVKLALFSEASDNSKEVSVIQSMDGKAYLRPGTGEGYAGVRNQKMLTLSDMEKARKLPKYDWQQKLVYQTPASHRVMVKTSSKDSEGVKKLINESDSHFVLIRPKSIIGSSGMVWASESVRFWHSNQFAFEVKAEYIDSPVYSKSFGAYCTILHDCAFQFKDMTVDEDPDKLCSKDQSKQ
eukprot:gene902-205_t